MDKTWDNFKSDFSAAHKVWKTKQRLRQSGFNSPQQNHANNVEHMEMQQDTAFALQALADATQSDREAFANLSQANQTLTLQFKETATLLQKMDTKISHLESKIDKLLSNSSKPPTYDRNSEHYCWSHGRTFNSKHTSASCRINV